METKTQNQTAISQQTTFEGLTVINGTLVPSIGSVWDLGESSLNWATVHTSALKSDTNSISVENNKITNLDTPPANGDAATKLYVDKAKLFIDLTPTTTAPTAVKGRVYYGNASNGIRYYNGIE